MASSEAPGRQRWLAGIEVTVVFTAIILDIWWLRFHWRWAWTLILGAILISQAVRGETPAAIGFRWSSAGLAQFFAALSLLCGMLLAGGLAFGTMRDIPVSGALLSIGWYLVWGLFQQYLLNGYFVNRLGEALPDERHVPLAASILFAAAHLPNWFLVAVTFAGGYVCANSYLRRRNLYVLGFAHGAVGFLLYLVVPDSISHHLAVGPR
jgi:hypothetical protein